VARVLIISENIYTSAGRVAGGVVLNGTTIEKIVEEKDLAQYSELETIDARGNMVLPGFIDMHIHGSAGWAVGTADEGNVRGLSRFLPSVGVTSYHPTCGGETVDVIKESLRAVARVKGGDYDGARILGVHMEGPFLNPAKKGAFIVKNLQKPSVDLMKSFIEASEGNIIHVTLAPEVEGAKELIEYLVDQGIMVAGGHTDATFAETEQGIEWGVTLSNHTCNAQRSIHHREPGALGAYLLNDDVYCELICDFFHVHPEMVRLVMRLKGPDKVAMISDSIIGAGLKPGKYEFSGKTINIDAEGWSKLPDGTISGSTKSMAFGIKNMVELGYSIEDVSKMASFVPAKLSKVEDRKGSIGEGKDADLVIMDKDFNVVRTYVEGKLAYDVNDEQPLANPVLAAN